MSAPGHLVLRRGHVLWAVPNAEVRSVKRRDTVFVIELIDLMGSRLVADEVLGIFEGLVVRPKGNILPSLWPMSFAGSAVLGEKPVVIVDSQAPPLQLLEVQAD